MNSSLYEQDFLSWKEQQALLLRAGRLADLDIEHIREEIEDMRKEQKLALQSLLLMILVHLLKLEFSPVHDPRNKWIEEVLEFRAQAETGWRIRRACDITPTICSRKLGLKPEKSRGNRSRFTGRTCKRRSSARTRWSRCSIAIFCRVGVDEAPPTCATLAAPSQGYQFDLL